VTAGLRLLMTADAVGGVWQYATDLARELGRSGVETHLALLGPAPSAEQRALAGGIEGLRLIETGTELDWLAADRSAVARSAAMISHLAVTCGAHIIHLNSPALAIVDFEAPVLAVAHSCLGTWWEAVRGDALSDDFAWRDRLHREGLRAADRVVAPSHAFAAATARRHGIENVRVVHNGRTPLFAGGAAMRDVAFTAGRLWDGGKNIAALDRAAARLSVPFEAAGSTRGPNGEAVELNHLACLGQIGEAEMGGILAARPVFASSALYEPFGLAVLEAASAGCALVLADIPTFRELWDDAAIFVAANDHRGFAAAIERLIGDVPLRLGLGALAQTRAADFSTSTMADRMLELYRELLPNPVCRPRAAA
jgi:glycosyltransferase involved in cell wall biosynthesis